MDLTEPQKFGVFETRNQTEYALLLAELQVILESDNVVAGLHQIFLAKLDHRVRPSSGDRVFQSHRPHRTEPKRFVPPSCQFFNRKTGFKVLRLFKIV